MLKYLFKLKKRDQNAYANANDMYKYTLEKVNIKQKRLYGSLGKNTVQFKLSSNTEQILQFYIKKQFTMFM